MKPMLYVANIDEDAIGAELASIDGQTPVPICAKIEAEMAELSPRSLPSISRWRASRSPV